MASTNVEFRVGLIILLGVLILAASLYWLQGYKLERNAQVITVRFDDVGTLAIGDRVTVSGVRKGKVDDLQLTQHGVLVKMLIYKDVILKDDARFVIRNLGLMGERFIAIYPGQDSARFNSSLIPHGEYDPGLPDVMGKLGEMVSELRTLMHSFRQTVGSDSTMLQINKTVGNMAKLSTGLSEYFDRNQTKLDKTADNFFQAAKRLNQILANNSGRIDTTVMRFDEMSQRLNRFTYQLDTLSTAAREFADMLNNPDGSMQLLMQDRRLYDDLRMTADNIDDLVKDIRANPRKYINLKVEIF